MLTCARACVCMCACVCVCVCVFVQLCCPCLGPGLCDSVYRAAICCMTAALLNLLCAGDDARALAFLRRAAEVEPMNFKMGCNLLTALIAMHRLDEAHMAVQQLTTLAVALASPSEACYVLTYIAMRYFQACTQHYEVTPAPTPPSWCKADLPDAKTCALACCLACVCMAFRLLILLAEVR